MSTGCFMETSLTINYILKKEHKEREAKNNIKTGRRTKPKRFINIENKLRVTGEAVGGGMG